MTTLHKYLIDALRGGCIDFSLRANEEPGQTVKFYVHPSYNSGDTADFLLWQDPETGFDLLVDAAAVGNPTPDKLIQSLKQDRAALVSELFNSKCATKDLESYWASEFCELLDAATELYDLICPIDFDGRQSPRAQFALSKLRNVILEANSNKQK